MTRPLRQLLSLFVAGAILAGPPAYGQVKVVFTAMTPTDAWDAKTYRGIWQQYGQRIVAALERRTCLPFSEATVRAVVTEAVSNSGGPAHPMRLRASYSRDVKQATLVHELGHRHLWQLAERLDDVDGHMTLYLVLERVWADVWGQEFAARRIEGESEWDAEYADAWGWAQSLEPGRRAQLWNRLLEMNGRTGGCDGPLEASERNRGTVQGGG